MWIKDDGENVRKLDGILNKPCVFTYTNVVFLSTPIFFLVEREDSAQKFIFFIPSGSYCDEYIVWIL